VKPTLSILLEGEIWQRYRSKNWNKYGLNGKRSKDRHYVRTTNLYQRKWLKYELATTKYFK